MAIRWVSKPIEQGAAEVAQIPLPCGILTVKYQANLVQGLAWTQEPRRVEAAAPCPAFLRQLRRYLDDPTLPPDIDLLLSGTPFQRRVWQALLAIPAGQVMTYGGLARHLGSSPRAVAQACRRNPYPVVIPCHRLVASQGLGGYNGATRGPAIEIKRWLLGHEGWQR